MNQKHFEIIQVLGFIAIVFFIGFATATSIDYFSDGTINCYPSNKATEIEENRFQFTVRCYIK